MGRKSVTVVNRLGLHARAAAKLVNAASAFESEIHLIKGAQEANGKSIMAVMMLAAGCGTELELRASGADADAALQALEALFADRFGEES